MLLDALADPARLDALTQRGLPDPEPEDSFDRLTRWARRGLGTTGAYVNFIDARDHVYKSAAGSQPPERVMPVRVSPCAIAVALGEVLAVEDVTTDKLLAGHPIAGAGIRGYLAVPLKTNEGLALGTICVMDTEARVWTPEEVETLEEIALVTMTEIELKLARAEAAERLVEAERLATTDPLTGLANRRAFSERLQVEIDLVARQDEGHLSLVLFDLDGFKAVNDRDGHAAGDALLVAITSRMAGQTRAGELLTRIGGDELALLVPGSGAGKAVTAAERLRAAGCDPVSGVTVSAGVGTWSDGLTADDLTRRVDQALYAAKRHGGDRVVVAGQPQDAVPGPRAPARFDLAAMAELAQAPEMDLALDAVNAILGMHVCYATQMDDTEQVFLRLRGDGASFGVEDGTTIPIDGTYCHHIMAGRLPEVIGDVRGDPIAGAMGVTQAAGVGAFASVPLRLSDGRLVGTLCCASHDERSDLGPRDVAVLHLVARIAAVDLERRQGERQLQLLQARTSGVAALAAAIAARDHYTGEHSRAVVGLAGAVATDLGLDEASVTEVEHVALLHDVGKLSIPDAILRNPGPLSDEDWVIMRTHPIASEAVVREVPGLEAVARAVRSEHERWDGGGYPDGLAGEAIPLAARITLACDAYHAMISDRPYRSRLDEQTAHDELRRGAGSQFDPEVVAALLGILEAAD